MKRMYVLVEVQHPSRFSVARDLQERLNQDYSGPEYELKAVNYYARTDGTMWHAEALLVRTQPSNFGKGS